MKKRFQRGAVVGAACLLALFAGHHFLAPAQQRVEREPAAPETPPGVIRFAAGAPQLAFVKVAAISAQPLPVADPVSARIAYDEGRTARIASPVLGRVLASPVEIGDTVRAGSVLAEIDSPDLATAQADWRKAAADEKRKQLALTRVNMLFGAEVVARKDLEEARADYDQAEAEVRRASQRLHNLQADVSRDGHFALRAPIAGIVADKQVNLGLEVRPDQAAPLFVVSDLDHLWAIADVPERLAAGLRRGQAVLIEADALLDTRIRGRIDRVGVAVDPATRRVQVRCQVDNRDGRLKPEMFARVGFVAGDGGPQVFPVPNTALFTRGNYSYVFVETAPGTFMQRQIHVQVNGAETSYVDAGLRAGERVVSEGALLLSSEGDSDAR